MGYSRLSAPEPEKQINPLVRYIALRYYADQYKPYFIHGNPEKAKETIDQLKLVFNSSIFREGHPYRGEILTVMDGIPNKKAFQWFKDQISVLNTYETTNTYGFVEKKRDENYVESAERFYREKLREGTLAKVFHRMIPIVISNCDTFFFSLHIGDDMLESFEIEGYIFDNFEVIELV